MSDDTSSGRTESLHIAIIKLEEEMMTLFARADIPSRTRKQLELRLQELKTKAGVNPGQ